MSDTNTKQLNLFQRLLAITEEIGKIEKTGTNSSQGYKFIEQARVVAEVRVQLAKHGVMIIPETVSRTIERYLTTKPGYQGKPAYEQASYHINVVSRYTLVNVDDPKDRLTCEWDAGEALDTSDKATNKATTASQKYFLMKLFNISDQDDPDATTPEAPAAQASRSVAKSASQARTVEPTTAILATDFQKAQVTSFYRALGHTDDEIRSLLKADYGIDRDHPMTTEQAVKIIEDLK